jgi:hypothetical protein
MHLKMTVYRVSKKKTDIFVIQISRKGISFFLLTLYMHYTNPICTLKLHWL